MLSFEVQSHESTENTDNYCFHRRERTATKTSKTEEKNHHKKQAKQRKNILSLHTNTETAHPINTANSSFSNVKRHETVHPNTQSHETDKNKFKILSLHTETFV